MLGSGSGRIFTLEWHYYGNLRRLKRSEPTSKKFNIVKNELDNQLEIIWSVNSKQLVVSMNISSRQRISINVHWYEKALKSNKLETCFPPGRRLVNKTRTMFETQSHIASKSSKKASLLHCINDVDFSIGIWLTLLICPMDPWRFG